MCYPKPGPRCSSHARKRYLKAQIAVLEYAAQADRQGLTDDGTFNKLIAKRKQAEREFLLTPAGFQSNRFDTLTEHKIHDADTARRLYEAKKALAKQQKLEAKKHRTPLMKGTYGSAHPFGLPEVMSEDSDFQLMVNRSMRWIDQLTEEEVQAIHWYSMSGFAYLNGYLTGITTHSTRKKIAVEEAPEALEELATLIDSALAKHTPEEVTVYRRHLVYRPHEIIDYESLTEDNIDEHLPEGSTFEPGFFLSTSLFNHYKTDKAVMMEIRSKSAVPIVAAAAQGPNETEYLIPRTAKFRVVDNKKTITNENGERLRVVVLEEI